MALREAKKPTSAGADSSSTMAPVEPGGAGSCLAFYPGPSRKRGRTPWRMQMQELAGDKGEKRSEVPARATVLAQCFDAIAALLPPGSVRGGLAPLASQQPDELA
ncbi:hypothetical protein ZWY2020_032077 [Hordeum vulgare]|nr:hypothetical protein ZWY2020_032077 [Hordeum vulgare]